jgi:hypothetical protein
MNNRVSSYLNREKNTVNILRQSSTSRPVLPRARVLAVLLVVPLLAGCASPITLRSAGAVSAPTGGPASSSNSVGSGSFVEPAAVQKEYSAAVSTFPEPLPTRVTFPSKIPAQAPDSRSQPGVGASFASFYWLCAWEHVYLAANTAGNKETATAAAGKIGLWTTLPWSQKYFDDSNHSWRDAVLTPALHGDASGVQAQYQGDCGIYRDNNG